MKYSRGKNPNSRNGFKKGHLLAGGGFTNHQHSELSKSKISLSRIGKSVNQERYNWRGDNVSYRALHSWVIRKLGYALKCEYCGKTKTTPKSIQWANKGHKYKRNLTDWIQLCVPCHKAYDKI